LLDTKGLDNLGLRTQETESQEDKLCREELLGSRDLLHLPTSSTVLCPFDTNSVQASKLAILVNDEVFGGDAIFTGIWIQLSVRGCRADKRANLPLPK